MTLEARARVVRRIAVGLQLVAIALVAVALFGVAWAAIGGLGGAAVGLDAWTALELVVLVGLIVMAVVGLRRWTAGGSPTLLYGFDALPVFFLLFTAGPGALQDPLGLGIAAAFVVPALVTWAASGGGGAPARSSRRGSPGSSRR